MWRRMDAFNAWVQVAVDLLNLRLASSIKWVPGQSGLCRECYTFVCCAPGGRGEKTSVGSWDSKTCYYSQHTAESLIDQGHQTRALEPGFFWQPWVGAEVGFISTQTSSTWAKLQLEFLPIRTQGLGTFPSVPSLSADVECICFAQPIKFICSFCC